MGKDKGKTDKGLIPSEKGTKPLDTSSWPLLLKVRAWRT